MNDFTASNGATVCRVGDQVVMRVQPGAWGVSLEAWQVSALGEFFQAEADERLGRWRWPENPDYVVYPMLALRVRVVKESSGSVIEFTEADTRLMRPSEAKLAARAYFDAHPEPKPWHEAVEGEFWAVRMGADDLRVCRVINPPSLEEGVAFIPVDHGGKTWFRVTAPTITSAVRIWPEVSS